MSTVLSIIIPVYNTEKYLPDCLDSIIETTQLIEIILIDDGSTDKSGEICDNYAKKDKRIKVIHKKNGGVSSARNIGINKSSGKYIMFVDSDDVLTSEWSKIFANIKNDDIYYFDININPNTAKENMITYLVGNNQNNICIAGPIKKLFKRDFLIKNNIKFDELLINGEDMIFNIEALLLSKTYAIIPILFYLYRQSGIQATRSFNKKIVESDMHFHQKLESLLNKYNLEKSLRKNILEYCKINAILLIINRISYIKHYKYATTYFNVFEQSPYLETLKIKKLKMDKFNKVIFKLTSKKHYKIVFNILKIKNRLFLLTKFKKNNTLLKI